MRNINIIFLFTFLMTGILTMTSETSATDLENTLYLDLKNGRVTIGLRPDLAPKHVTRIKQLVREGFYDGLKFHRVIPGFMAQGGDPSGNGTGGSGVNIDAEFSKEPHVRGILSMARSSDPNSADSQFFIVFADAPHLDGQYTVWGKVTDGMKFVSKIKRGEGSGGEVVNPDKIIKMQIRSDVK